MPCLHARTEILIGPAGIARLRTKRVLVAGLGGVGGHVAEALGRAGVGHLTLLDHDVVSPSNLNRQLLALHSTLGRPKVDLMAERLQDIDPTLEVTLIRDFLQPDAAEALVTAAAVVAGDSAAENSPPEPTAFDYVADCIDSIACKAALVAACHRHRIPVISALGAGNCLDANRVRVTHLDQTDVCPLARELRRRLRQQQAPLHYPVVYSDEPRATPLPHQPLSATTAGRPRAVNGTISYMPALFGLLIAGHIVQQLLASDAS